MGALPHEFSDRNELVASDKNPTEGEVDEVQRASRYDLVARWRRGTRMLGKAEKSQLLDEVCHLTGYTRKHAVALLKHPPPDAPPVKQTRHRSGSYGPAEVDVLQLCWLVTDGICAKRLAPFLPELLRRLLARFARRPCRGPGARGGHEPGYSRSRATAVSYTRRTPRDQHHQTRRAAQTPDRHSHIR